MVSVISQEGLGDILGMQLGQGLSAGVESGLQQRSKQRETEQLMQMLGIPTVDSQSPVAAPQSIDPQQIQERINKLNLTPEALAAISIKDPQLGKALSGIYESQERARAKREQLAEPELLKREQRLGALEETGMRFDRLEKLFSPELEDKFPSALSAATFTKDGELRPMAAALLSPEAQESVKLIADELKGLKDTFGARITNFEIKAYMKRLPTLLNTAEGRRRILRDLRLMNDMNKFKDEKVLDIIDRHGGPSNISISKAERLFRKEYQGKMKEMKEQFVNPEKSQFSELPLPGSYKGKRIVDEETGQVFRSDGNEWIPENR